MTIRVLGWGLLSVSLLAAGWFWVRTTGWLEPRPGIPAPHSVNPRLREIADKKLSRQQWEVAASSYRQVLDEDPFDGQCWLRYGYCLHMNGNNREAVDALDKAMEFLSVRTTAAFYSATAYLQLDDKATALQRLKTFVDSGGKSRQGIQAYRQFASLLDDAEFRELAEREKLNPQPGR